MHGTVDNRARLGYYIARYMACVISTSIAFFFFLIIKTGSFDRVSKFRRKLVEPTNVWADAPRCGLLLSSARNVRESAVFEKFVVHVLHVYGRIWRCLTSGKKQRRNPRKSPRRTIVETFATRFGDNTTVFNYCFLSRANSVRVRRF